LENHCFGALLAYSRRQLKYLLTNARSCSLVETSNQEIRGFIIILYRKRSTVAAIETLDVDPRYHGQGIGLRLLKAGEEEVIAAGMKSIRLEVSINNLPALRLYEKAGYRTTEFLSYYYLNQHDGTRHAYRMVKRLV
jgi:ribosomal protein S18 acetylase RimI-like enzyme